MEEKNTKPAQNALVQAQDGGGGEHGAASRPLGFIRRLFSDERPESLRGLKGVWLLVSSVGAVCVVLALLFALFWDRIWACAFAAAAHGI